MRISDWSSDVCSSDLGLLHRGAAGLAVLPRLRASRRQRRPAAGPGAEGRPVPVAGDATDLRLRRRVRAAGADRAAGDRRDRQRRGFALEAARSEEHTSELQSLMRISYAVFCLKKKKKKDNIHSLL